MILSLICFTLGVACYGIKELQSHGKLRWMASSVMSYGHGDFWGSESWRRKYKYNNGTPLDAPENWYYRLIGVDYKERWFTSTWLTVAFTDGYHLCQWGFIKLFVLSVILYEQTYSWYWDGAIYLGIWYLTFNIVYKIFGR